MATHLPLRGIVTMLAAVGFLSLMDAGLKQLSPFYPPVEIAALRGGASWPLALSWVFASGGARTLFKVRWRLHLLRGALAVMMIPTFVYALRVLPLTTAYVIFFIAPMMITALSALILNERVSRGRWLAVGAGFAGVLVAMRPTGEGMFSLAALSVLAAATGYALAAITVRSLAQTDSKQALVFWVLTSMTFGSGVLAIGSWVPVAREHWWIVGAIGVSGALGQYAITEAFRIAEASVIAPLEYSALGWGLGCDLLLWGVLPDAWTWAGAAIIVASGVYLMRHERDQATAPVLPESAA
ncbi:MAG TPA: DMT family transporter [Nevskiaceae bacterium]|nr:DMT family transporter [Nevskiaceae bacterium]